MSRAEQTLEEIFRKADATIAAIKRQYPTLKYTANRYHTFGIEEPIKKQNQTKTNKKDAQDGQELQSLLATTTL